MEAFLWINAYAATQKRPNSAILSVGKKTNMNSLDLVLLIAILAYFLHHVRSSALMCLGASVGGFVGFMLGIVLTAGVANIFRTDLARGMFALAVGSILAAVGLYIGRATGDWLHRRIQDTRWGKVDDWLLVPSRLVAAVLVIVVFSQTLIYLPIVSLQYLAQGSTTLMVLDRYIPDSFVARMAQKVAPQQFLNRQLEYDQDPLTYTNLRMADDLKAVARLAAPSVVKVSGRSCPALGSVVDSGSGFIISPGYVMTSAHMVIGQSTIYVRTHDSVFPVTPISIDERHDLAVLYSKFLTTEAPLSFANTKPQEGANVLIMGYPGAGNFNVLKTSVVSSVGLNLDIEKTSLNSENSIKLASGLWKGSSGGPIIDSTGKVVAVTYASDGIHSLGVDAEIAKQLMDQAEHKLYAKHTGYCKIFKGYR